MPTASKLFHFFSTLSILSFHQSPLSSFLFFKKYYFISFLYFSGFILYIEPRRQRPHYHSTGGDILASGWMTADAASRPRSASSVFDSTSTPTGHHQLLGIIEGGT
jgi:hypothetical protein